MIGIFASMLLIVGVDQLTKFFVIKFLSASPDISIIDKILSFGYVENRGAAFGVLRDSRWLFVAVTVLAVGFIIWYVITKKPKNKLLCTSIALIGGGALGNFIDRLFFGRVIDFIKFSFFDFPYFNLADTCLSIGVVLLAIYIFTFDNKGEENGGKLNN